MSIESVMPSYHLILRRPLLPPSIFPSIRVFSNESVLHQAQIILSNSRASPPGTLSTKNPPGGLLTKAAGPHSPTELQAPRREAPGLAEEGQGGVQGTPGTPGPPELTTGPQPLGESTTDVCANPTAPDYRQDPPLSPQNSVSLADMNKDTSFQDSNTPPKVTFADGAPCQDFTALGLPVLAYENASYAKNSKQTLQIQCSGQKGSRAVRTMRGWCGAPALCHGLWK